jgi:TolA-binding protein
MVLSAFYVCAQDQEKDLFSRAEARFDAGQYATALDLYNEFLASFPLSDEISDVQYRRAVSLTMLGQYDDALALLKRIETAYRATRFVRFLPYWTGIIMYHRKDYPKAIESFSTFLALKVTSESNGDAWYYKGVCELESGSYKDASDSFSALEKNYPQSNAIGQVVVFRSYLYLITGDYKSLIDYAEKADTKKLSASQLRSLLYYKAEGYYRTGATDAAAKLYESLFVKDSDKALDAFLRLFAIAKKSNDFAKMESLNQTAGTLLPENDPGVINARITMGIEYFKKANYDSAKLALLALWNGRAQHPVEEAVPLYLSESYIKTNDFPSAEKVLTEHLSSSKVQAPKIKARLGYVYILEKKFKEARDLFSTLETQGSVSDSGFDPYYYLAYAYYKSGDYDKALEITDKITAQNKAGTSNRDFFKLQIRIIEKTQGIDKALASIRQYVSIYPDDVRMRIELCKILLTAKDFVGITREAQDIKAKNTQLVKTDPYAYLLLTYLDGLAKVGSKSYKNAVDTFGLIQKESLDSAKLAALYPFTLYYKGWALYKQSDYKNAASSFARVADEYTQTSLAPRSLYLAGWCLYSSNDFDGAIRYFSLLADYKGDASLKDRAFFFKAKSLLNEKKTEDAKAAFRSVFTDTPKSEFADDALFEYAGILSDQGKPDDSAASYAKIAASNPGSPLAEDGLYRRAEVYYTNKMYEKAKNAFYDYRVKYPSGKLLDASLYWGGLACFDLGEKSLAVLLWEKIISELKSSTFRANALVKTADIYTDSSEYSKALSLYTELISKYPADAATAGADQKAATLKYLVLGLGKKEAELVATVERNNRDTTAEGRKAIVGLAKLYMTEFGKDKLDVAYSMLLPVINHKEDIDATSDAQYLLGEYYNLHGEYIKAGNEFVKAAVLSTNNKDRMAHSIYRAAEMMKLGGNSQDALDLVDRLERNFPQSDWTTEGRKLVKGMQ